MWRRHGRRLGAERDLFVNQDRLAEVGDILRQCFAARGQIVDESVGARLWPADGVPADRAAIDVLHADRAARRVRNQVAGDIDVRVRHGRDLSVVEILRDDMNRTRRDDRPAETPRNSACWSSTLFRIVTLFEGPASASGTGLLLDKTPILLVR